MTDSFSSIQLHVCWVEFWNVPSLPLASVHFQNLICTWTFCVKIGVQCLRRQIWVPKRFAMIWNTFEGYMTKGSFVQQVLELVPKKNRVVPDNHEIIYSALNERSPTHTISFFNPYFLGFLSDATTLQSHNNRNMTPLWSTGEQLSKFIRRQSVYIYQTKAHNKCRDR